MVAGDHVANAAAPDDDNDCATLVLHDEVVPFCLHAVHNYPSRDLPDLVP